MLILRRGFEHYLTEPMHNGPLGLVAAACQMISELASLRWPTQELAVTHRRTFKTSRQTNRLK